MKPKAMKKRHMQQLGSYRPPSASPNAYNLPRRGRVGKMMPSFKQFRPFTPTGTTKRKR